MKQKKRFTLLVLILGLCALSFEAVAKKRKHDNKVDKARALCLEKDPTLYGVTLKKCIKEKIKELKKK